MSSEYYHEGVATVLALHDAIARHGNDSEEADGFREQVDGIWSRLEHSEQGSLNRLSGDLWSLTKGEAGRAHSGARLTKFTKEDADGILDLLVSHPNLLPDVERARLRAKAYEVLGLPDVATQFAAHVSRLEQGQG